ncbi:MAG: hypothetical protein IT428_21365 [Planctomycetaceae bacterium]|jgi:hypothetical protein|nr:hypothetical protein [Planctomycetaceae bacterium]
MRRVILALTALSLMVLGVGCCGCGGGCRPACASNYSQFQPMAAAAPGGCSSCGTY